MRRVILREFGPYSNLQLEEVPDPEPADGEVLVAIEAAGVGFVDTLCVRGAYQALPSLLWPDELVPIPGPLSAGQAAGLLASYGTMLYAFTRRITIAPDEWVVVLGAGGGVGLASIDIAKYQGARVIACASTEEKLELATRAGADVTIGYEDAAVDLKAAIREITGGGADVVVDPVGGDKSNAALRALGFEGRYVLVGFASGVIPDVPLNQVLLNDRSVVGVDWGLWAGRRPEVNAELLGELFDLVVAGALCPAEPTAYELTDAATALDDLEHRRVAGKVVLVP